MPEPSAEETGERHLPEEPRQMTLSALQEVLALVDAGELTATSAQRSFLAGAIAAQDNAPLLYK